MNRRLFFIFAFCIFILLLAGCNDQQKPIGESTESIENKINYEAVDGEIADYLYYNFQERSMYIAGLKLFEEFSMSNEGTIRLSTDENVLIFSITKSTGTVTGAVDGPLVYFKMDLDTNEIIDMRFEPAPNYGELGKEEFIEHSQELIQLTNERMVEIGKYFKELIMELEAN